MGQLRGRFTCDNMSMGSMRHIRLLAPICFIAALMPLNGQRPQAGQLDAVETVKRYVGLRFQGSQWGEFAPLIVWADEHGRSGKEGGQ
jgi:hypothetical protein